ncbi:helix-turn-helix domain-containing protein [Burkholderia gladioli]|uniref:helix-turn-helix domain-containing protein n=1 Tax=Burkholderia gladioli TaxID=28095 RepID=UPI0016406FA9|nr:helix-turn-helix domain-containing protein [Burkholderia gladioli]
MRSAKKSAEELRALRHALPERIERDQPDVGEATRWIREAIGVNQAEFARLVGLSKPLIARIERGKANPTLDTLRDRQDLQPAHCVSARTNESRAAAPAPSPPQAPSPRVRQDHQIDPP